MIIPEVPEWRQLDLAPRLTTPTIRSAIDSLQTTPGVHEGPFGLVGFSFGAPHTVAAAGDPALRADVATAVGFGGYCDPRRTIHFMMTGQHEHNGDTIYLRPDPYGRWIVAANYLTDSVGYEGAIDVADALRRLATLAGDTGTPAWSPQYDRAKVQMGEGLAPDSRELFDLIAPPSHREPDVEEGAKLAGPTLRGREARSAAYGPHRGAVRGRVPGPYPSWAIRPSHPVLRRPPAPRGIAPPSGILRDGYRAVRALRAGSVSFSDSGDPRAAAPLRRAGSGLRHGIAVLEGC